jgi:KipI family sensor histidine kinase inhibitor
VKVVTIVMRVRAVGASALLIECADAGEVEAWRTEAWRRREAGDLRVDDIVPGERTVLLDGVDPSLDITWTPAPVDAVSSGLPLVRIPVTFDGADLPDIARRWELSEADAVERLAGTGLTVAFCGFAPGFAYMRGLDPAWAVPRLETPRAQVPAGAVGLAGSYVGIYPAASPGGWRLVGRTREVLWDVERVPPARLAPGTRVRLEMAP